MYLLLIEISLGEHKRLLCGVIESDLNYRYPLFLVKAASLKEARILREGISFAQAKVAHARVNVSHSKHSVIIGRFGIVESTILDLGAGCLLLQLGKGQACRVNTDEVGAFSRSLRQGRLVSDHVSSVGIISMLDRCKSRVNSPRYGAVSLFQQIILPSRRFSTPWNRYQATYLINLSAVGGRSIDKIHIFYVAETVCANVLLVAENMSSNFVPRHDLLFAEVSILCVVHSLVR